MTVIELINELKKIPNQEMDAIRGLLLINIGLQRVSIFGDSENEQACVEKLGELIYNNPSVFHKEYYLPERRFINGVKGYCILFPIGELNGKD